MGYADSQGFVPLREAIADYLRRMRGVRCSPEDIVIVSGSQQGLDLIARVALDPGDVVAIEDPHYRGARHAFEAAGARFIPVAVDDEGLRVEDLPARMRPRLIYTTPSHQFPTGGVLGIPRRLGLLGWASAHGAYILEDDYDAEYQYEHRPVEAIQGLDREGRVIYMGTFSKVLFPALRVGYLVLPPQLLHTVTAAKSLTDWHTPLLSQQALAGFMAEGHFERHLRRSRARNSARRLVVLEEIAKRFGDTVRLQGAAAGVHLLLWLERYPAAAVGELIARARSAGVGVYPVAPYYLRPPAQAGLLLGYASLTEADIRDGIRRLAACANQMHAVTRPLSPQSGRARQGNVR
jgi:GntR family transcriptional regulator/MocR family aminotransferase